MSMSTRSKTARLARRQSAAASTVVLAPPTPEPAAAGPAIPTDETPPADKCAICLSNIANKCKTNSCRHEFCFACLLEWSKVKAECPLCKSNISTIIHNIRLVDGREVHDTYSVPATHNEFANLLAGPPSQLGIRINLGQIGLGQSGNSYFREFGLETAGSFNNYLQSIIHFGNPTVINTHGGPPPAHASSSRSSRSATSARFSNLGQFPEGLSINVLPVPFESDNPFVGPDDDLAGAELHPDQLFYGPYGTQSYQRRRRIYDRGQYVTPFSSSMQPGAVFFPSVEYFSTHAIAFSRIKPWLKRELTVLLGLTTPRSRLAALYELITSLLIRYDIRGREFREMIRIYFENSARVKHFQHELYHFALSGLGMAIYDRVATYPETRRGDHPANASSSIPVPVVTLDDDEEAGPSSRALELSSGRRPERRHRRQRADADTPPMNLSATASSDQERWPLRSEANGNRLPSPDQQPGTSRVVREESRRQLLGVVGFDEHAIGEPRPPPMPSEACHQQKKPKLSYEVPKREPATDDSDSDDCELLGVHPIVKPPPLAVITIESDSDDHVSETEVTAASQFGYYVPERPKRGKKRSDSTVVPNGTVGGGVEGSPAEVASTSSSSVHVLEEIRNSRGTANGVARPSSPKPSTSAAARARLNGHSYRPPMKKSDYMLRRMLADMDSVVQEFAEDDMPMPVRSLPRDFENGHVNVAEDTRENWHKFMTENVRYKRRRDSGSSSSSLPSIVDLPLAKLNASSSSGWKPITEQIENSGAFMEKEQENSVDWDYTAFAPNSNSQREEEEEASSSSSSSASHLTEMEEAQEAQEAQEAFDGNEKKSPDPGDD